MSFPTWIANRSIPFSQYLFPPAPFYGSTGERARRWSSPPPAEPTASVSAGSSQQASPPSSSRSSSPSHYLSGHTSYLRCARCSTDLCLTSQIISKGFTGRHGRAYLVCPSFGSTLPNSTYNDGNIARSSTASSSSRLSPPSLPNTTVHKAVPRQLVTGAHTVSDISCTRCGAVLGWKYVAAEDEAQRYKVGKFILETKKVCVAHCWEEQDDEEGHNVTEDVPAASKKNGHQKEIGLSKARNGTAGSKGSGATASPSGDGGVVSKDDGGNNGAIKDTAGPSNGMVIGRPRISDREKEKDRAAGEVQFDSQDEEECDDLFAGVWSPALANRRRSRRRFGRGE